MFTFVRRNGPSAAAEWKAGTKIPNRSISISKAIFFWRFFTAGSPRQEKLKLPRCYLDRTNYFGAKQMVTILLSCELRLSRDESRRGRQSKRRRWKNHNRRQ